MKCQLCARSLLATLALGFVLLALDDLRILGIAFFLHFLLDTVRAHQQETRHTLRSTKCWNRSV